MNNNTIATTLFHDKVCDLPGIGQLKLINHSSRANFANGCIEAPFQEICFLSASPLIAPSNNFHEISQRILDDLTNTGECALNGIGVFYQSADQGIQFASVSLPEIFRMPAPAMRVIRKDAPHTILVGDKELSNHQIVALRENSKKSFAVGWWIWAIVIAAISVIVLAYYITQFPEANLGNSIRVF